jgi:hypothetical protein
MLKTIAGQVRLGYMGQIIANMGMGWSGMHFSASNKPPSKLELLTIIKLSY